MLYAVRANRQYKIEEQERQKFIDQGYKIAKLEKGKLVVEKKKTPEDKQITEFKVKIERLEKELEKYKKAEEAKNKEPKDKGEGK